MNRKHKNFIGMLVGVLALLSTLSFPCFAEGTTTIHMSADSPSVGDTLSVTVRVRQHQSALQCRCFAVRRKFCFLYDGWQHDHV